MKKYLIMALLGGMVFQGCTPKKQAQITSGEPEITESADSTATEQMQTIDLSELGVVGNKKQVYNESEKRINDLLNTKLDVKFDWDNQYVLGQATLDLKPYFYPTSLLTLDAKGFEIKEIAMMKGGQKTPLKYEYRDNAFLDIELGREYKANEQYTIFVDYIAKPNELEAGGSAAITEDKGLYFINPEGEEGKPQQIWTQGETEASSCWFPTIDSPNERSTQDIHMTVRDEFVSLSNGKFMGSQKNGDGTRTDHWKQDQHHAPYLFMLAAGDFSVIKDEWKGIPVHYYVEKEYESVARRIFGNTPEMIEFYSNILDYPYPWDKYHQIVVREFVSGAMENTSAVIFFDAMNRDARELLDEDHEDIVAHELFHHWFGDIVTCESWANLPLNESFATYGEYLWIEHKYGQDEADNHLRIDLRTYLNDAENNGKKDLIRYGYEEREDMFDGHSYQKGGRVLHMLRNYVGDEAFFKSLNVYLKTNEFKPVEIHQLRLAFEEVTGEDLNWFFNQWFLNSGHPILNTDYNYDAELGKAVVTIKQTQDEDVFELPMAIDMYFGDKVQRENVIMNERKQTFSFNVDRKPDLINVDGDKMLLCEKEDDKTVEELAFQFKHAPLYLDRYEVLMGLLERQDKEIAQDVMIEALSDKFWAVRGRAIQNLDMEEEGIKAAAVPILKKMAKDDKKSYVRSQALAVLSTLEDNTMTSLFSNALNDSSYTVVGSALSGLAMVDKATALTEAKKMEDSNKDDIIRSIGEIYGTHGSTEQLDFFENGLKSDDSYTRYVLFENYGKMLEGIDDQTVLSKGIETLKDGSLNDKTWWTRLSSSRALLTLMGSLDEKGGQETTVEAIGTALKEIKEKEEHPRLKMFYMIQMP